MFRLKDTTLLPSKAALASLPGGKLLINTLNAHSYNTAQRDPLFARALLGGDVLIPDGAGVVMAMRWLYGKRIGRVAGADLFEYEMARLNERGGTCFFLGSSEAVLARIRERAARDYPRIRVATYSPPYKPDFSPEDNEAMVNAVNAARPDLLWIGMTAPKQEKWAYAHFPQLDIRGHAGTIGAVFDFYAGTVKRAPRWWQEHSLEWLYRLLKEPRRMWRRYLVGNVLFLRNVLRESRARRS